MRVLLVGDDLPTVRLVSDTLAGDGGSLRVCGDGAAVPEALYEGPVDLLLLDVDLKGYDAFGVCRSVRSRETGNHRTAIITITGPHDVPSRLLGFVAGADDWLARPIELRDLRSRLDRWGQVVAGAADVTVRRQEAAVDVIRALCHELNNPLAAAVIGVELVVRRGSLSPESARDLSVARENLDRIDGILGAIQGIKNRTAVSEAGGLSGGEVLR
jgi:DNA-binding response OmpR family regulator